MCHFQTFHFLCGHTKVKTIKTCHKAVLNSQGLLLCPDDPNVHIKDLSFFPATPEFGAKFGTTTRKEMAPAFGPGICSNVRCRWKHGLLPMGEFGDDRVRSLLENDKHFNMSEEACVAREKAWYRLLTPEQQSQCAVMTFPVPVEKMSPYALARLCPNEYLDDKRRLSLTHDDVSMEQIRLLCYVTAHLLPAEVTIPGGAIANASSPHKPTEGPFKVGLHICQPSMGVCRACGKNHGDPELRAKQLKVDFEMPRFPYFNWEKFTALATEVNDWCEENEAFFSGEYGLSDLGEEGKMRNIVGSGPGNVVKDCSELGYAGVEGEYLKSADINMPKATEESTGLDDDMSIDFDLDMDEATAGTTKSVPAKESSTYPELTDDMEIEFD